MNNVVFGRLNEKIVPLEYTGIDTDTADITVDNDNKTIKVDVRGVDGVVRYDEKQYLSVQEKERARNNIGVVDYVGGTTETAEVHINGDTISVDVTNVGEIYTAGDNIQISADNVISATDTTYNNLPASEGGDSVSLVTTGEKYTWGNKQDALVSGTNIKTINNESVLGSGNISIVSYHNFNPSWITNGTTEDFCSSIVNDSTAIAGMTYLGKLMCSDLPGGLVQGEAIVEIISDDANGKAIDITLTSVTNSPYRWTYARAKVNGSYVNTGWKAYQLEITSTNKLSSDLVDDVGHINLFVNSAEKFVWNSKQNALVSGSNIKTINNTSVLGTGNIDTTELFECTFGTTTYAEVTTAISNEKIPYVFRDGRLYFYYCSIGSSHYFTNCLDNVLYSVTLNTSNNWSFGGTTIEKASNKVTSISSSSTDTQYPSAKAVYDSKTLVTFVSWS